MNCRKSNWNLKAKGGVCGSGDIGDRLMTSGRKLYAKVLFPQHAPACLCLTTSSVRHLTALLWVDLQYRVDPRSEEANQRTERCAISRVLQIKEAARFDERVAERSVYSPRTLPTRPQSGPTSSQQLRGCRRRSLYKAKAGLRVSSGFCSPASPGKLVLCRSPFALAKSHFSKSSEPRLTTVKNARKVLSSFRTRLSVRRNNYNSSLPIKSPSPRFQSFSLASWNILYEPRCTSLLPTRPRPHGLTFGEPSLGQLLHQYSGAQAY